MNRLVISGVMMGMLTLLSACSSTEHAPGTYRGYETPNYKVSERDGAFEIREYAPALMAEVRTQGDRGEAVSDGFRILAAYIFGKNEPAAKVAMTSPVTQVKTTIAMTSPVTQAKDGETWLVQFMMPSQYTLKTLPKAKDDRIRFFQTKAVKKAVVMFSGFTNDSAVAAETAKLKQWVEARGLKVAGEPVIAYYDDPFTFPWNRRNEIQLVVEGLKRR
ncbi:MAG: heme-binding protein [Alphaproteobacteria bacterium]|nr:heme-binding protein [Alphaproteobacteria bacterium]